MRNSEPASAEAEGLLPRSLVQISPFIWRCVRAQFTVSVVIPPVVGRVNITGNRSRVVAQQVLLARSGPEEAAMRCLFPAGAGPARVGCGNSGPARPRCVGLPVGYVA